jgi:ubiquinone/menaquinone biosynthesis C-methylase UbiE
MAEMHGFARWWVNRTTATHARRALNRLAGHLELPPSPRILELGSGGGGMLALLQERYHPSQLVGTDFDAAQLGVARTFLERRWGSLPASIELRAADALAIPFPDASFEAVFAMMMLHHVEAAHHDFVRRPQALKEVRRVLRPAGRLVYSEFSRRTETRSALLELGFVAEFVRSNWRTDLAVYRSPG